MSDVVECSGCLKDIPEDHVRLIKLDDDTDTMYQFHNDNCVALWEGMKRAARDYWYIH